MWEGLNRITKSVKNSESEQWITEMEIQKLGRAEVWYHFRCMPGERCIPTLVSCINAHFTSHGTLTSGLWCPSVRAPVTRKDSWHERAHKHPIHLSAQGCIWMSIGCIFLLSMVHVGRWRQVQILFLTRTSQEHLVFFFCLIMCSEKPKCTWAKSMNFSLILTQQTA